MPTYGYVRISTAKQSIDRQIRNIRKEYPEAVIISEVFTGTTVNREKWGRLFGAVKAGDTIIFDSVSRMSRDAKEGFTTYEELYRRGVNLIFLKEPHISTNVYRRALEQSIPLTGTAVDLILSGVNLYLLGLAKEQIRLAFDQAQKEVDDLHQRTREGIQTARLNGKQIGQKQGVRLTTRKGIAAKEVIQRHSKDFGGSLSDSEVMKLAGVSRNSFYKYKAELKEAVS